MTLAQQVVLALPELGLLVLACAVLLAAAFSRDRTHALAFWLAQLALVVTLALTTWLAPTGHSVLFHGSMVLDPMAVVLKSFVCALVLFVFVYSREYLARRDLLSGEYFALGLFAVLGMMIIISAGSFLTAYLGLELLSLALYSMVAMYRDSKLASEAAMKYFVLGALASGMLLYGISMIYGVTGALDFPAVSAAVLERGAADPLLAFGLSFIVVGVAFKLGVVPFHAWIPDVYQGAPTSVTLFVGTAPKIAAYALAMRILVDGLGGLGSAWSGMLTVLALLSMAVGNVIAIAQTDIRRMLAYSTIAHMGYLLLGLIANGAEGYSAAMFYVIVYAIMGLGSFGMVILMGSRGSECESINDFRGLARLSPWYALVMLVLMFSMAGLPPFAGFWAKWFVLKEVIAAGHAWLAAVAVFFSIIGAYYYLRVVKVMYFDEPETPARPAPGSETGFVMSMNALAVLGLGLMPGLLMALCLAALRS